MAVRLAATPCSPLYNRHSFPDRELAALVVPIFRTDRLRECHSPRSSTSMSAALASAIRRISSWLYRSNSASEIRWWVPTFVAVRSPSAIRRRTVDRDMARRLATSAGVSSSTRDDISTNSPFSFAAFKNARMASQSSSDRSAGLIVSELLTASGYAEMGT